MGIMKKRKTLLDMEIERLLNRMSLMSDQTSDEYEKCMVRLERLVNLQQKDAGKRDRKGLDPNTVLGCATSTAQTLAIIFDEQIGNIIRSKAFSRIIHPKF